MLHIFILFIFIFITSDNKQRLVWCKDSIHKKILNRFLFCLFLFSFDFRFCYMALSIYDFLLPWCQNVIDCIEWKWKNRLKMCLRGLLKCIRLSAITRVKWKWKMEIKQNTAICRCSVNVVFRNHIWIVYILMTTIFFFCISSQTFIALFFFFIVQWTLTC